MKAKLPALEKNILKYRALQMVLLLNQVESFKVDVISAIRNADEFFGQKRLPLGAKNPVGKALAILVSENIISDAEKHDILNIIMIRNDIGHRIHDVVGDISFPRFYRDTKAVYDYFALERFEGYRSKISKGMSANFISTLCIRGIAFEQAEATYKEELGRLRKRMDRQWKLRYGEKTSEQVGT